MQPPRIPLPTPLATQPFTNAQARAAGIGRGRLRGRDIDTPFRGVHLHASVDLDLATACRALLTRCPAGTFVCGPTAAALYGMPLPNRVEYEDRVHIAVPAPATAPTGSGIRGHSYVVRDRELTLLGDLPISIPERAWCELSRALGRDELVAAGDFLIHHGRRLASRETMAEMVDAYPDPRGRLRRRDALMLLHDRSESPRESHLRVLFVTNGLVDVEPNLEIRTSDGFRYRGDLVFVKERVIIEYQGSWHEASARYRDDMTRRSRLRADGWTVVEVSADDLRDPAELLRRVRRILGR